MLWIEFNLYWTLNIPLNCSVWEIDCINFNSHHLIKSITGYWRSCASDQWRAPEVESADRGVKDSDKAAIHVENWDLPAEFWENPSTHQGQMAAGARGAYLSG